MQCADTGPQASPAPPWPSEIHILLPLMDYLHLDYHRLDYKVIWTTPSWTTYDVWTAAVWTTKTSEPNSNWTTCSFGPSKFGLLPKFTTPSFKVHPFRLSPTQPLSWSGQRRVCQQIACINYTSPPTAYTEVEILMFHKSQTLLSNTSQNKIIWHECRTGNQQSSRSINLFRS